MFDRRRFALCAVVTATLVALGPGSAVAATAVNDKEAGAGLYFPPRSGDWETISPEAAGWSEKAIEEVLRYAGEQRSTGLVILHRGRIMAERYWEVEPDPKDELDRFGKMTAGKTARGHALEDVASAQKSVVSFLVGVAEGKGLVDFEAPASRYLGKGWSKATPEQEGAIKVHHLVSMSSGLAENHSYKGTAGSIWMYNTPVYSQSVKVLEKASGMKVNEYTAKWLTEPIGMSESKWAPRPWAGGTSGNSIGFVTSTRDLARFGLLVLADGRWDGKDLLGNRGYLERALAPSQKLNPSYGYLWWLNGQESVVRGPKTLKGPLIPNAPADLAAAQGALGRKCYVVPSLDLVVTRLGGQPPAGNAFNDEIWKRLSKGAP